MPFVVAGGGRLDDSIDENAPVRCARRITDAGGDRLEANIKRHTPIGPPGGDRVPGTLRKSIHRTRVRDYPTPVGQAFAVTVETDDPIAPFVEFNTQAHDIPNAFGFGHEFGIGGPFEGRFHPGTTGQHPFSRGTAELEGQLDEVAAEPLQRLEREIFKG